MEKKYVVIIQCDIAHNRCSGFNCTQSFYNRENLFENYGKNIQYISFTCGGCCGKGISVKLEHLSKRLKKHADIKKEEVIVHLASCMSTDNYHYDRCPHIDYIKNIVQKKGYTDIIEGSYISKGASQKRKAEVYKTY